MENLKINLEIVDITKPYNHPQAKVFSRETAGTDIAGIIFDVAKRNHTNPEDLRVYFWPYNIWDARALEFICVSSKQ